MDDHTTEILLNAWIEQIYNKERQGTSFTKAGWQKIVSTFNERTRKNYKRQQLKNRLDILRKEWRAWENLFSREIGIGWDAGRSTVHAEDWWWQEKIQENKAYEKYRYNGMMFARELKIIFKDVMASGQDMFAPSSTQPQPAREEQEEEEDVYRPTMDQEEGSGDSEDDQFGVNLSTPIGLTDDFTNMAHTTNTTTGSGSHGKRKRAEGSTRKKKEKAPTSRVLADAISVIAAASTQRTSTLNKIQEVSLAEVTAELIRIQEVASDDDFRTRCLQLMLDNKCREIFVALRGERDLLLHFLRETAYNPPPWLKGSGS